jgi:hypothetical protein
MDYKFYEEKINKLAIIMYICDDNILYSMPVTIANMCRPDLGMIL